VIRLWAGRSGVQILARARDFLFPKMFRPAVGPIQFSVLWVPEAFYLEAHNSPLSSAKIKNFWSYTSTNPQNAFMGHIIQQEFVSIFLIYLDSLFCMTRFSSSLPIRIKPLLNRDFICLPFASFTFFKSNTVNPSSTLCKCLLLYLVSRPHVKHLQKFVRPPCSY